VVRGEVLRAFDVEPPVLALELDLESLERHLPKTRRYRDVPRYPALKRDLSLLVPPGVTYAQIHMVVQAHAGPRLESLQCFDVYEGAGLDGGVRSLGLRLRFRDPQRTLADEDVGPSLESIVRGLANELRVTLRAGA
jgi:phenylalanyl-tRNA synthetase beta chain